MTGYGLSGTVIAALFDPSTELGDVCRRGVVGNFRCLRHRVCFNGPDTGEAGKSAFDHYFLTGPVKTFHLEHRRGQSE